MFVRWKRRKRRETGEIARRRNERWGDSLNACLVESTRTGTKVRQKVICYVGTVSEKMASQPHIAAHFWRHATPRLDGLELSRTERAQAEESLIAVVPKNLRKVDKRRHYSLGGR
jgi:hypothetical protein